MLHDARRALTADHPLVHRMIAVALDIFDGTVLQIDFDAAPAGTHVTGGRLDLVPGLERGVDLGLGHQRNLELGWSAKLHDGARVNHRANDRG